MVRGDGCSAESADRRGCGVPGVDAGTREAEGGEMISRPSKVHNQPRRPRSNRLLWTGAAGLFGCRSEVPCTAAGKTARDCNADWLDALQGAHPGIRQSPPTDREHPTRGDSRRDGIFWHDQREAPRTADSAGCKHRQSRADRRRVSRVTPPAVFHPCRRTRARSSTLFWAVPGRGLLRFFNPVREAHRAGGRGPGAAFWDLEKQWEQRAGRPWPR